MLESTSRGSPISSLFASTSTFGRPRRGTPAYAAAVRLEIARLAARYAAETAAHAPSPPAVMRTIVVNVTCSRVRAAVCAALTGLPAVQVVVPSSSDVDGRQRASGPTALHLVDRLGSADALGDSVGRTVLICGSIPRSDALPAGLGGVLALPLNRERLTRTVLSLLDRLSPGSAVSPSSAEIVT